MYLKRIDLLGFKSFTEKTKIELEPGISCIVGPNGSGKSNISDALRWVLGEQNARLLRGNKQEDVIFAGSKKRKPLGMAEVSITLDNSDGRLAEPFNEVTITRRAYRSGDGEYLINNKPCRLKDVTNLLLDSGVGLEGLALIGQDRVHEIVTAKPEGRRAIIEDASGIIKYRNRKREAMRKLAETERHLERIGDIVGELGGRIEPLRQQAEAARSFLLLSDERDDLEIALFLLVLDDLQKRLRDLDDEIAVNTAAILTAETAYLTKQAAAEELKAQISSMDEDVALLRQQFYNGQNTVTACKAKIEVGANRQEQLQKDGERLTRQLADLSLKEEKLQEEKAALTQQESALKQEVGSWDSKLASGLNDEQSRKQALVALEEELQKAKDAAFDKANFLAETRNKLRYQDQLRLNIAATQSKTEEQRQLVQNDQTALRARLSRLEDELTALDASRSDRSKALHEAEAKSRQTADRVSHLVGDHTVLQYDVQSLTSRIATLEEMSRSGEGIFPGVRGILAAKQADEPQVAGVIDVISHLMDIDEQYQTAIEVYLGANLQNIVTATEKAAKGAVAYLKKQQKGRATFLPLDILQVRDPADFSKALQLPGVIGRASELVRCDKKIRPAVDFLLNRVLLVEDLDSASAAARSLQYRYNVVALSGDMINPGASISGGSKNIKGVGLLGQRNQIKQAEDKLAKLTEQLAKQEAELASLRQKAAAEEGDIEARRLDLAKLNEQYNQLVKEKDQLIFNRSVYDKQELAFAEELAGLKEQLLELDDSKDDVAELLEAARQEEQELTLTISGLSEQLAAHRSDVEAQQGDLTQYRVELATKQQELLELNKRIKLIGEQLEAIAWDKETAAADIADAAKQAALLREEVAKDKEELLGLERQIALCQQELELKAHGLLTDTEKLAAWEKELKSELQQLNLCRDGLHEQQIKKARLEADFGNEQKNLTERFQMGYEQALQHAQNIRIEADKSMTRRELSLRLGKLRREIEELGPVNPGAVEEYDEVSARYGFLTAQREDLTAARASLDKVIHEMDDIMASRFRSSFRLLSEEFDKSFKRLFGGGSAELIMTDPDNLLETGVDILVNLPGKQIVNYNLLSGGEKALCGLALLFAVLAVRPTPFCVMDEVDSALDEANVDRFGSYLADLSQNTQFLMISHRQGTMEKADNLWGVTMEEEGVSKILSVHLRDINDKFA